MKHCPNPECHGLEKFRIVSEYDDEVDVCADCGAALVDGPAPEPETMERPEPEPELNLVPVLVTDKASTIAMVQSLLDEAGIEFMIRGEKIQDLFGMGRLVDVNPITGPVEFHVLENDYARAVEVLADVTD